MPRGANSREAAAPTEPLLRYSIVKWSGIYTVNHKKRDILFFTVTLANFNRFL